MKDFDKTCFHISEVVTRDYSTSFHSATRLLGKEQRQAIFSIYGFVRFADEIVDTFIEHDKKDLLEKFESELFQALERGLSMNPVLHAFQFTVKAYGVPHSHIRAFLGSMKTDLVKTEYREREEIRQYVYGSADVVGLMCLRVFCHGNEALYGELEAPAMRLGSAFQKVNFLRDLKNDMGILQRKYFPELQDADLDENNKKAIIGEIKEDFLIARQGIKKLPGRSQLAVTAAYLYYLDLLRKLEKTPAQRIVNSRIRISDFRKGMLLFKAYVLYSLRSL